MSTRLQIFSMSHDEIVNRDFGFQRELWWCLKVTGLICLASIALTMVIYPFVAVPELCFGTGFGEYVQQIVPGCSTLDDFGNAFLIAAGFMIFPFALWAVLLYVYDGLFFVLAVTLYMLRNSRSPGKSTAFLAAIYVPYSLTAVALTLGIRKGGIFLTIEDGLAALADRRALTLYLTLVAAFVVSTWLILRRALSRRAAGPSA